MNTTRMRLERLGDERANTYAKIEDTLKLAEDEQRDPDELEQKHLATWRERVDELDDEINLLAADLERAEQSRDVSALRRGDRTTAAPTLQLGDSPVVYRTFAQYARDQLIVRFPQIAAEATPPGTDIQVVRGAAEERLQRVVAN